MFNVARFINKILNWVNFDHRFEKIQWTSMKMQCRQWDSDLEIGERVNWREFEINSSDIGSDLQWVREYIHAKCWVIQWVIENLTTLKMRRKHGKLFGYFIKDWNSQSTKFVHVYKHTIFFYHQKHFFSPNTFVVHFTYLLATNLIIGNFNWQSQGRIRDLHYEKLDFFSTMSELSLFKFFLL